MVIRLVQMTFQPEEVETFLAIFEASKSKIRAFEGCEYLELIQDSKQPHVLMTHSHWTGPEALEAYRQSELFRSTWAKTKVLFAEKPWARSFQRLFKVD